MTAFAEETKIVERAHSHVLAEAMLRFRELGIVLALVLVVGATTIDNHLFLSSTSVQQLLSGAAIIALLAIGETIVIITRNVDLSVGSIVGLTAYLTGRMFIHIPGIPLIGVFIGERLLYAFRDPVSVQLLDGITEVLGAHGAGLLLLAGDSGRPPLEQILRMPLDHKPADPVAKQYARRGITA